MNKKVLFSILSLIIFATPVIILAAAPPQVTNTIDSVKDGFIAIGAGIVVIGWIVAGILYLTSAGSPEKTGTAKKAMIACIIGTVLIIISATAPAFIAGIFNLTVAPAP